MKNWIENYLETQRQLLATIPVEKVAQWIELLAAAARASKQIFVFGNGGSAANASHFATDLGKSASDSIGRRFRVLSLNDNVSWITAIGNDYAYEDIYLRQLENYAQPGDLALTVSVSGNSPNCVKALTWAKDHGLVTLALTGGNGGQLADIAEYVIRIEETHFGRAEDAQMTVMHLLCYAFVEESAKAFPETARFSLNFSSEHGEPPV